MATKKEATKRKAAAKKRPAKKAAPKKPVAKRKPSAKKRAAKKRAPRKPPVPKTIKREDELRSMYAVLERRTSRADGRELPGIVREMRMVLKELEAIATPEKATPTDEVVQEAAQLRVVK